MKRDGAALLVRLPEHLHKRLKQEARRAQVSLNKYCIGLLSKERQGAQGLEPGSLVLSSAESDEDPVLIDEMVNMVLRDFSDKVEGIILFGSWARGQALSSSDVDLLIVLNSDVSLDRDLYALWKPQELLGHEVSPLFVHLPSTDEEIGGVWFEVAIDGVVIFDRSLNLNRFLSRVRGVIADGRVERKMTHGHPYWVWTGISNLNG